ncbi:antibiotic biosynthesis monooxygenase [Sulfurovum sp.]|uniref:antibiotic biosynthesis monooxygenase family protein n=1 Tax=Sulfurovum sp. TaxID=1969726 RepID=UPI0035635855
MYAVIFEVKIKEEGKDQYLAIAAKLKEQLIQMDGFISIERFQSLVEEGKLLSLSYWESIESIEIWKQNLDHLQAQSEGRAKLFEDYRIRIADVVKDYTMETSDFS